VAKGKKNILHWARRAVQGLAVSAVVLIGVRALITNTKSPIDDFYPLGGFRTLFEWLVLGQEALYGSGLLNLIVLGVLIVVTVVAGGIYCGWFCPLGAVQEWLYQLRLHFFKREIKLPPRIDKFLRYYLKYIFLAVLLIITVAGGTPGFLQFAPFRAVFGFSFQATAMVVVLALIIISSLLIERFWCRYLCPQGAFIALLSKISFLRIRRTDKCANCNRCMKQCSLGLEKIGDLGCNSCMECVNNCHIPNKALSLNMVQKETKRNKALAPVAGVVLVVVLVFGSWQAGIIKL